MIQWASSYFTYNRGARLITGNNDLPGWHDPKLAPQAQADGKLTSASPIRPAA
ncbi:MAG: hypothetical protein ABSD75_21265 [Terriglobales bacterium]|jgi:hypothetical protein